jgi:hypothetical protein
LTLKEDGRLKKMPIRGEEGRGEATWVWGWAFEVFLEERFG